MSVQPNQTNLTPGNSYQFNNLIASTITFTGASSNYTYTMPGLTSTSVVLATYEHPSAGGAAQWLYSATPGTNNLNLIFGQNTAAGESINLLAVKTALANNPQ